MAETIVFRQLQRNNTTALSDVLLAIRSLGGDFARLKIGFIYRTLKKYNWTAENSLKYAPDNVLCVACAACLPASPTPHQLAGGMRNTCKS